MDGHAVAYAELHCCAILVLLKQTCQQKNATGILLSDGRYLGDFWVELRKMPPIISKSICDIARSF